MRTFKLVLAYDGTDFHGWQRLPGKRTVQGAVETALARVLGSETEIVGSGRTDSGVHARAQTASFRAETSLPPSDIASGLARVLPKDVACLSCEEAGERFHARYAAVGKIYLYRLRASAFHDPFEYRYSWLVSPDLDPDSIRAALAPLAGTHDFSSFTNLKAKDKSFVRMIDSIDVLPRGEIVELRFSGDGFLQNQVRIMAGAAELAGRGRLTARAVEALLEEKDRSKAPPMAPACGLFLESVRY